MNFSSLNLLQVGKSAKRRVCSLGKAFSYTFREIILKCDEIKASIFNALLYIITTFLLINAYINHSMACLGVDEALNLLSIEVRESFVRI